jgi:sigma-B regulation protein RsbU (phosphoserine phosphatase)
LLLSFWGSHFANPLPKEIDSDKNQIGTFLEYYPDKTFSLTVEDFLKKDANFIFQRSGVDVLNLGYVDATYWVRFSIVQKKHPMEEVVLLLANHSINHVDLHILKSENPDSSLTFTTGNLTKFNSRPIEYREFAFPISIEQNKIYTIYMKIQSKGSVSIPITVFRAQSFYKMVAKEETLHGIYYGVMLTMVVYNLLILLNGKDISYLFYALYIMSYTVLQGVGHGHAFQFLWPNYPSLNDFSFVVMITINILASSLLSINFLKTKIYSPLFHKIFLLFILIGIILISLSITTDPTKLRPIVVSMSPILAITVITASLRVWARGFKPARYFFVSWLVFDIFIIVTVMKIFGIITENFFTEYGIQVGSLVQAIFLSYSLSDKVNEIKKENQEATLRTLQYQEAMKFELEKKVKQRTEELNRYILSLQKDLQMASSIQMNILPKRNIELPNFKIVNQYIPLDKVGGDFFDIYEFHAEKIRIFIADATGHGVQAALLTMSIKSEYDGLKSIILQPSELLEELHIRFKQIYRGIKVYFSAVVVDLDLIQNKLTYCSAGHPDQFLIQEGKIIDLERTGKIIGLTLNSSFVDREIDFHRGDKLLLFTDGVYEEFNSKKEQFGENRLKKIVNSHKKEPIQNILESVLTDLETYLGEKNKQDDITIIGVQSI